MTAWLMAQAAPYIAGFVALAVAYLGVSWSSKKRARAETEAKAARTKSKQEGKGRDAVAAEKRAIDGLDNRDLVDRVRRRDGDWRGV